MFFICNSKKRKKKSWISVIRSAGVPPGSHDKRKLLYGPQSIEKYGLLPYCLLLYTDQYVGLPPHLQLVETPENSVGTLQTYLGRFWTRLLRCVYCLLVFSNGNLLEPHWILHLCHYHPFSKPVFNVSPDGVFWVLMLPWTSLGTSSHLQWSLISPSPVFATASHGSLELSWLSWLPPSIAYCHLLDQTCSTELSEVEQSKVVMDDQHHLYLLIIKCCWFGFYCL